MTMTILYIDDDVLQLKMIERMLARDGFKVLTAADGHIGVRVAMEQIPKLVLLDVNMPNIDGLEVTQLLKTATHTRFIPVVALTANVLPGDKERILAGGFDGYLAKPVTRNELIEMITRLAGSGV
jgi:CheY-like chemotaxis protein